MNRIDEFIEIVEQGKQKKIIPFLKKLTKEEKNTLVPVIKKYYKIHSQYVYGSMRSDKYTSTEAQYHITSLAAFVILNYTDFSNITIIMSEEIDKQNICSWYCPEWLNKYMENHRFRFYFKPSRTYQTTIYKRLLEYIELSYCTPSPKYIAETLDNAKIDVGDFKEITIDTHMWYLFEYETEMHKPYENSDTYWLKTIKNLIDNKSINRKRVLRECILSSSRFSNRAISSYFYKMLEILEPTNNEILVLQNDLLLVLANQHSKPINQILKYLKRIHKEPNFNLQGFIEQVPLLLSWDVKAVVNGTLSLIDALIKAYPKQKQELALLAVQTLGQEDESLQTKAVKLLSKHKLLETSSILEEINIYSEGLYHSTKQLLPTLDTVVAEEENIEIVAPQRIREDNHIPTYESFDELVFFFSQVFEQNNVYDFDLFIALVPKLNILINEENINKLSPAFALAEKAYIHQISNDNANTINNVVSLMSLTFLEFMLSHKSIFSKDLNLLYTKSKLLYVNSEGTQTWFPIKDIKKAIDSSSLEAVYARLLVSSLQNTSNIPLLSTPTHTPCWIDSKSFILLLKEYQDSNWNLASYDIQIALSRVVLDKDSIQMIKNELHGELKDLLLYLFTDIPLQLTQIKNPAYWLVAVLRRGNESDAKIFTLAYSKDKTEDSILALSTWKAYREPWEYDDWEKGVKVKKSIMSPKFNMQRKRTVPNLTFDSIFKHTSTRYSYDMISKYDSGTFLLFTPTLPHFLLENLLAKIASSYESSYVKRTTEHIITLLLDIWDEFNATSYLFVAYILTFEDKTARTLASELWIKSTTEGTMNHELLGQILGKLEHNEYAPLKRFTDLIVANMLNISTLHNQGLYTLFSNMIISMNDEPIKGTKKLLEIYLEVLALTKMKVPAKTLEKLVVWRKTISLRPVIKKFDDMEA